MKNSHTQLIIVRQDLNMSPITLSAQVSHAAMAFLTKQIKNTGKRVLECTPHMTFAYSKETDTEYPLDFRREDLSRFAKYARQKGKRVFYTRPVNPKDRFGPLEYLEEPVFSKYTTTVTLDRSTYEQWIQKDDAMTICMAENREHLLKAKTIAEELGMKEDIDFFLIRYYQYSTQTAEEYDKNGHGYVITCIGFRPMENRAIDKILQQYAIDE